MNNNIAKFNSALIKVVFIITAILFLTIFIVIILQDLKIIRSKDEVHRSIVPVAEYNLDGLKEMETKEIFSIPESQAGLNDLSFITSPDGSIFVYIVREDGQERVVLNGQAEPYYDNISFLIFSPDSQRFAYGAKLDGKEFVVLDGQIGQSYDWIFKPYFFTPDSSYFVYKARTSQGEMLVVNQEASELYDYVYAPFVTTDNNRLIYYSRDDSTLWRTVINLE